METKESMQITVQTLPNGYALTVNGEEFMYFNPVTLLAGFMARVGLGKTGEMEKGSILNILMSAMLGSAFSDSVETLKQRVSALTTKYETSVDNMDAAIKYVNSAHAQIDGMKEAVDRHQSQLNGFQAEYLTLKHKYDELMKQHDNIMETLSNSATLLQAIKDSASKNGKKETGDEGGEQPDKSDEPAKKRTGRPKKDADQAGTVGKGSRNKAADAQIVKEITKQKKKKSTK